LTENRWYENPCFILTVIRYNGAMLDERYQWLFRKMPVPATSSDGEGRFLDVSDAWVARMGFSREELIGRRAEEFCTAEYGRIVTEEYIPLLRRTGELRDVPIQMISASGQMVEFLVASVIEYDRDGNYLRSVQVYKEIAEHALIERRYRELYRSTPAMLHTVDRHGRILAVSDWWLGKLGYQRSEVLGRSVLDFMSRDSREDLEGGRLEEFINEGETYNVPRQMVTKNGVIKDVLISTSAERDHQGGVDRLLVAAKDVTERNRDEQLIRDAYKEVAQLKEELERERDYLREEVNVSMNFGQIVGRSAVLKHMLQQIEAVAATTANVLILGESGVGKELVARAIHAGSSRAEAPLVKVNCASVPRELFESEFFGHVKGAFTGATRDRVGRFQLADGGSLFLDEVAEIPIELQGKLLRVLQEREFEPVGDDRTRSVDVRVIAATNKDLEVAVEEGRFREDLYYRLSVFPITVPPLRKRKEDIVQLAVHFLDRACKDLGHSPLTLTRRQADMLTAYDWPGNIRELQNLMERAVILSRGGPLRLDLALPELESVPGSDAAIVPERGAAVDFITEAELRHRHRANTVAAMRHAGWRVSGRGGAAQLLGIKPTTLNDRLKTMGIERPKKRL